MKAVFAILLALLAAANSLSTQEQTWNDGVAELMKHKVPLREWFLSSFYGREVGPKDGITCALCDTAASLVLGLIRNGEPLEQVEESVISLCKTLEIVSPDVCEMIVPLYADPLFYMVTHHEWLTQYDACGILLGGDLLPGCFFMNNSMTDWVINLNYNKPPLVPQPLVPDDVPRTKVIHLTDIHPDLHYVEGSLSVCGKPMCCRPDPLDDPTNSSIAAGPWGDWKCDFPIASTENVFVEAATRHPDAEFVLMTGDLVHHQVWNTTQEDNLAHYSAFRDSLAVAFPSTKIYPAIGNHEPHPCNMFPPMEVWEDYDLSWMYDAMAEMYANDLTPQALATFRKAGYYTELHKPGFRIVTINTNFCYTNNFWLIYNAVDPEGHLQWFSDTMYAAEQAGEKVWIVGHVPPGSGDCWSKWSMQFLRVINRYEAIIMAQFYGHTHNDEIRVFFDDSTIVPRPTGSLFIGVSVTPYTDLNPGYKVFYADGERAGATWEILDHETWVYNLQEANEAGLSVPPEYYKLYSAKEAYGLESFRPADLWDFVQRMALDDDLFRAYYKHYYKGSGFDETNGSCPSVGDVSECKFDRLLCGIVQTDYSTKHCNIIKNLKK